MKTNTCSLFYIDVFSTFMYNIKELALATSASVIFSEVVKLFSANPYIATSWCLLNCIQISQMVLSFRQNWCNVKLSSGPKSPELFVYASVLNRLCYKPSLICKLGILVFCTSGTLINFKNNTALVNKKVSWKCILKHCCLRERWCRHKTWFLLVHGAPSNI